MPHSPLRTIVVDVIPKDMSPLQGQKNLEELHRLVETLGGITIIDIIQKRGRPSAKTFVGEGKAKEIGILSKEKKADLVIFNQALKATQRMHLKKSIECVVWDRIDLILHIFRKRAKTKEAMLQIELAELSYELPKLYGRGKEFSQLGGGIAVGRGPGEKFLEYRKRALHKQIHTLKKRLEKVEKVRSGQRSIRKRRGFVELALVGYTNSGKSTLLKTLTHKKRVYSDNVLFATLDTQIGDLWLPRIQRKCLVADTIGFIRDLPPFLLASFKATLEEIRVSDMLLHIVDAGDENFEKHIRVTNAILTDLACEKKKTLLVFNKIDTLLSQELRKLRKNYPAALFIIGKTGQNIDKLIEKIEEIL